MTRFHFEPADDVASDLATADTQPDVQLAVIGVAAAGAWLELQDTVAATVVNDRVPFEIRQNLEATLRRFKDVVVPHGGWARDSG